MPNHLTYIRIQNFKCFDNQTIPLNQMTVLAGGNSLGKSTVVQALLLLRSGLDSSESALLRLSNHSKQISLNGNYLLSLGNTGQVFNKNENPDVRIFVENKHKEVFGFSFQGDALNEKQDIELSNVIGADPTHFSISRRFYYLNAERIGPRLLQIVQSYPYLHCGWQGENTVAVLNELENNFDVVATRFCENTVNPSIRFQANAWMKFIIPDVKIDFEAFKNINTGRVSYNERNPYNVGFGISYILPIIVNGLIAEKRSAFIIENPEAHLHPYGQSQMGKFLAVVAASGVQVIVETHSEHIINGMRVAAVTDIIAHDNITINFFTKQEKKHEVMEISINERGELSEYPFGFFDQALHDQATIIKANRKKQAAKL